MGQVQLFSIIKSLGCAIRDLVRGTFGNVETPLTIEDTDTGAAGLTPSGVKSFSILFEGSGGALGGVYDIVSGYIEGNSATLGNTLDSKTYIVPSVADPLFPASPRVVISYVI